MELGGGTGAAGKCHKTQARPKDSFPGVQFVLSRCQMDMLAAAVEASVVLR